MRLRGATLLPIRGLGHLIVTLFLLYPPNVLEDKFSEVRRFGKLGALRLPLARESSVNHMINKVIVEPLSLALNPLSPKTQPLGYGAALLVFCRARDDHP